MNYITHLSIFFDKVAADGRLNASHVSMYVSLFQQWNINRFKNPISVSRTDPMNVSKISSKATYHRCLRDLHEYGYVSYDPSFNPYKGSLVYLIEFQTGSEQVVNRYQSKKQASDEQVVNKRRTGSEQVLYPSINNINNTNDKNKLNYDKNKKKVAKGKKQKKADRSPKGPAGRGRCTPARGRRRWPRCGCRASPGRGATVPPC